MFKNNGLRKMWLALVKMLVLTASLFSSISSASDYYYEFSGSFTWRLPTVWESCQKYFDWYIEYHKGRAGVRLYNFRVVPLVYGLVKPGEIYHCLYDLETPGRTFLNQRGQFNRRGTECPQGMIFKASLGECVEGPDSCASNPMAGNPVNILTGGKKQTYIDVEYAGMRIKRGYSHAGENGYWYFDFQDSLRNMNISGTDYLIYAHDGRKDLLGEYSSECWKSDGSSCYQVEFGPSSDVTLSKGGVEKTFTNGRLSKVVNRNSNTTTSYSRMGNSLVIESQGRNITVDLNSDGAVTSIQWAGNRIDYEYDANGMIAEVDWNADRVDYYLYGGESGSLLREAGTNGEMFAQWDYDGKGRVILSSRQDGIDKHEFQYDEDSVLVINPLGKETRYTYLGIAGINRLVQVQGYPTDNCVGSSRQITYYPNGMVHTKADKNGAVTRYRYNDRLLEVERVVAEGNENEYEVRTVWHETLDLKTEIIEPHRTTTFTYDDEGRLLSKHVVDAQ